MRLILSEKVYMVHTCKWGEFDRDSATHSVDYILWRTIVDLYVEQERGTIGNLYVEQVDMSIVFQQV